MRAGNDICSDAFPVDGTIGNDNVLSARHCGGGVNWYDGTGQQLIASAANTATDCTLDSMIMRVNSGQSQGHIYSGGPESSTFRTVGILGTNSVGTR